MSMIGKTMLLITLAAVLLAACTSQPTLTPILLSPQSNNPYAPQPGDGTKIQSNADIASAAIMLAESFPPQVSLSLAYRLPTPCYQLRVSISHPDDQNRIQLDVYGVAPKDQACTLMALATPLQASISLGSFPGGHYTIWVNGVQVGNFTIQ